jgi:hypothetical protein
LRDSPGPVRTVPLVVLSSFPLLPHRDAGDTRLPACKRHAAAARAKPGAGVRSKRARKQVCATRPAIARSAAVTSPGDMIAPGETPTDHSRFQMMPVYSRFAVTSQLHYVVARGFAGDGATAFALTGSSHFYTNNTRRYT